MKEYKVRVNFGDFIGVEEVYTVEAETEEEAIEEAREMVLDDCSFEIDSEEDYED